MSICKRIKELKSVLKMTSSELGIKLNIPARTIGSYERGEAQPGSKFLNALILEFGVNINWLLSGVGDMFITKKTQFDIDFIANLKETFKLSEDELKGLIDILETDASRDMILKFIQIKQGNKEALDSLIYNLQGIKAIYG